MNEDGWQNALRVLRPIEARIDAALASGDVESAVRVAFDGASQAAALVAAPAGSAGVATVHGVCVEYSPQRLDAFADGTLGEKDSYVNLTYRCWDLIPEQAERLLDEWTGATTWSVDSS